MTFRPVDRRIPKKRKTEVKAIKGYISSVFDIGAKSEIYNLINELIAQGKSIIMISSEMQELLSMSDRIIVMCEGSITGELDIADATQESIMALAVRRAV